MIWCLGGVSGAHINPCVTLTMLMTRKISLTRCIAYVIVQCVGATVGAAVLWVLTPSHRRGEAVEQCVMIVMTEVHDVMMMTMVVVVVIMVGIKNNDCRLMADD